MIVCTRNLLRKLGESWSKRIILSGKLQTMLNVISSRESESLIHFVILSLIMGLSAALLVSCAPLQPYSLETPPIILTPTSHAGVSDGRGRFRETFCQVGQKNEGMSPLSCAEAVVHLPGEAPPTGRPLTALPTNGQHRVVVVPGIFGECIADTVAPFEEGLAWMAEHYGYQTEILHVGGYASCGENALRIAERVMSMSLTENEQLILIGYSKGVPDILEALAAYPKIRPRIAAVVSVAGVVAGTPLADSVEQPFLRIMEKIKVESCDSGDERGVQSLMRSERLKFLASTKLPASIRYYSLVALPEQNRISNLLRTSSDILTLGEFVMTPVRRPSAWRCQETGSWWHLIPHINGAGPHCSFDWPDDAGEPSASRHSHPE